MGYAEKLAESLESDNVTVVQATDFTQRVQLLFRVDRLKKFLPIIDLLLSEQEHNLEDENERWVIDVSKVYMRYSGRLIYAWRLTLQVAGGTSISDAVNDVRRLLDLAKRMNFQDTEPEPQRKGVATRQPTSETGRADGRMIDGEVVEMPLVGMDATRNKPQAPLLTAGVRGLGKRSGVSSKGAHLIGPTREQY